jgi:hypothetical protein
MKNIHLLPTDKPSRLFNDGIDLYLSDLMDRQGHPVTSYNIYTTSDENIKEEDWVFNFEYNYIVRYDSKKHDDKFWYKKIILTTDQDLIKDGVQAIDDEFLEWFVKNPSCEYVEVKQKQHFEPNKTKRANPLNGVYYSYKIIIPQEEPKEEVPGVSRQTFKIVLNKEWFPRQETLEEAGKIDLTKLCYYDRRNPDFQIKEEYGYDKEEVEATGNYSKKDCACDNCFYGRSKLTEQLIWQADRMYSKEEVETIAKDAYTMGRNNLLIGVFNKWFEQFKNK